MNLSFSVAPVCRADEDRCNIERMLVKRITRIRTGSRTATESSLSTWPRDCETPAECEKNDAARKYEALGESGKKTLRDSCEDPWPTTLPAPSAVQTLQPGPRPNFAPRTCACTDRAEKLRASRMVSRTLASSATSV